MPDETSRFTLPDGTSLAHFMGTSTFSQYTVLPEVSVAKVSKEAPLDKVCLLGCGITTGYGAVINTLKVEAGASILVIGLGGVGLAAIMGALKVGATTIIGVDINPAKFERAKAFGATHCVNPLDNKDVPLPDQIFELTNGQGVDYSIECVGTPFTMKQAFESTKPNGGCSCVIGVAASGQVIELDAKELYAREWTGSAFGGAKGRDDVPKYVDVYMKGEIKVDEFITHHFGLKDIMKAFGAMHEGSCIRAIINLWEEE